MIEKIIPRFVSISAIITFLTLFMVQVSRFQALETKQENLLEQVKHTVPRQEIEAQLRNINKTLDKIDTKIDVLQTK